MRSCLILFFCLVSLNLPSQEAPVQAPGPDSSYVEREEKSFPFYPGGKVAILSEVPGNIHIIGWDKGSVRVVVEKVVRGLSAENARSLIGRHPLRIRHNETSATVRIEGGPAEGGTAEYRLAVNVPGDKTDIQTTIKQGDIKVSAVNGWIEVTSDQGDLTASSLSGYFSGSTGKGNITADLSGRQWRGLEFGAITSMGFIDLRLPAGYCAALKLETRNGKILIDYAPQIVEGEEAPLIVGVRKKAQALDSKLGDGGAPIRLLSHEGDIRLSEKKN